MFAERRSKIAAALDLGLYIRDHFPHGLVVHAIGHNLEGLYHRYTSAHHGGQLACKDRDVAWLDLATTAACTLFLDLRRDNALATQLRLDHIQARGRNKTFLLLAFTVLTFPLKQESLFLSCSGHGQSFVTRLASSRLMMP